MTVAAGRGSIDACGASVSIPARVVPTTRGLHSSTTLCSQNSIRKVLAMAQQPSKNDKQSTKNQNRQVAQPKKKSAPSKAQRRSTTSMLTWGAVGLVIVIVIALVLYSVLGTSKTTASGGNTYEPAPTALANNITKIPLSVYNTVGVTSSVVPVTPPTAVSGQPALTFTSASGTPLPGYFYFGAEYCPFCAAERWAVAAAISRFGTLTGLGLTSSSATDVYPNTQSVTFAKASLDSQYFAFRAVERYTNIPLANGQSGFTSLQVPTAAESALVSKYDTAQYFPGGSAGSIPFTNVGNQFLSSGASFSPSILAGLTRDQIASGLSDPTNPATQAIVATANYITASICKVTGGQPGSVCTTKGVQAAATAMKISF